MKSFTRFKAAGQAGVSCSSDSLHSNVIYNLDTFAHKIYEIDSKHEIRVYPSMILDISSQTFPYLR
jgi:hypothetical protein